MKSRIFFIIFTVTTVVFSGCRKKIKVVESLPEQQLIIQPEGIECESCAQLACKKLMALKGIRSATFVKEDQAPYEEGSIIIIHTSDASLDDISLALEQEGFILRK